MAPQLRASHLGFLGVLLVPLRLVPLRFVPLRFSSLERPRAVSRRPLTP
jgi:hypothetical protein